MRILMLGWEFPPFISGGLGTACYGLTKALDRLGHEIIFVLPKAVDRSVASHVQLLSPDEITPEGAASAAAVFLGGRTPEEGAREPWEIPEQAREIYQHGGARSSAEAEDEEISIESFQITGEDGFSNVTFHAVPSGITSPYGEQAPISPEELAELSRQELKRLRTLLQAGVDPQQALEMLRDTPAEGQREADALSPLPDPSASTPGFLGLSRRAGSDYAGDMMAEIRRYAKLVVALAKGRDFDVIHAHDWMTYPAGMALARVSGKPLVAHIHSTEFDRSGEHVNQQVYDIERRGMHSAMRVAAVSYWTKNIVQHRYGVDEDKIRVVWNGVEQEERDNGPLRAIRSDDKIVLFLGRITMQKGPEYFIQAAKRVLEKIDNVKFIVAGSGDMATRMIEYAASLGIGHKVLFTGFLRGNDVARIYRMADCYVMPSVSEPFGIAPLEAMSHNVPVIISKQSGVSEVLTHVLKVDFWDVDDMANKIVAVLKYSPLGQTLRHHGQFELRRLTWEGAAEKCVQIYEEACASVLARV